MNYQQHTTAKKLYDEKKTDEYIASVLGVWPKTIWKGRKENGLPAWRVGRGLKSDRE